MELVSGIVHSDLVRLTDTSETVGSPQVCPNAALLFGVTLPGPTPSLRMGTTRKRRKDIMLRAGLILYDNDPRYRACEGIEFLCCILLASRVGRDIQTCLEPSKCAGSSLSKRRPAVPATCRMSDQMAQAGLLRSRSAAIRLWASACSSATALALIRPRT